MTEEEAKSKAAIAGWCIASAVQLFDEIHKDAQNADQADAAAEIAEALEEDVIDLDVWESI